MEEERGEGGEGEDGAEEEGDGGGMGRGRIPFQSIEYKDLWRKKSINCFVSFFIHFRRPDRSLEEKGNEKGSLVICYSSLGLNKLCCVR